MRPTPKVRLFAGWRTTRRDSFNKRISSKIANAVRSRMLRDATPDTGCGLKLFEREVFLRLPYFDHMHRYLPALVKRAGYSSISVPVGHRPRTARRLQVRHARPFVGGSGRLAWRRVVDAAGESYGRRGSLKGRPRSAASALRNSQPTRLD